MSVPIDQAKVAAFLATAAAATSKKAQGDAFEDLIVYVFELVPGLGCTARNKKNALQTEEVDVVFWNDKEVAGMPHFPNIILVECKHWSGKVGAMHVSWFAKKMENKGVELGILFALNGIAGDPDEHTAAYKEVEDIQSKGRRLLILTATEVQACPTTDDVVKLLKQKICNQVAGSLN